MAENCNVYISSVILEVDGREIEDFKSVAIGERIYGVTMKLMNKWGFAKLPPEHRIVVDYVPPAVNRYDWTTLDNGRLTIEYNNGDRVTWTGVNLVSIGEEAIDGENIVSIPITLHGCIRTDE